MPADLLEFVPPLPAAFGAASAMVGSAAGASNAAGPTFGPTSPPRLAAPVAGVPAGVAIHLQFWTVAAPGTNPSTLVASGARTLQIVP